MPYEDLEYDEETNSDRVFEWILGAALASLAVFIGVIIFLC